MEKIYANKTKDCKLVKSKPQTVQFLLNYSKSLEVAEVDGIKIEINKN
jgi:hypothetical protein